MSQLTIAINGYNEAALQRLLDTNGGKPNGPLFDIPMITGGNRVIQTARGFAVIGRHPDVVTFAIKTDRAWVAILDFLLAHWPV